MESAGASITNDGGTCYAAEAAIATEAGGLPIEALAIGEALDPIRQRLEGVADGPVPVGALEGFIDQVDAHSVTGWARDPAALGTPVRLLVTDHGVSLGEVVARQYRADLAVPGVSHGCHGFHFVVPGGLSPAVDHVIEVRLAADGRALAGSPFAVAAEAAVLRGQVDSVTATHIRGWAQNYGSDAPVALQVLDNGTVLARVVADQHRVDLEQNGIGIGLHGFDLDIPEGLSPLRRHVIEVRRESDGAALMPSPSIIEAVKPFDAQMEQEVAAAIAVLPPGADQMRVLSFLIGQTERLLQDCADFDGQLAERRAWLDIRRFWASLPGPSAKAPLQGLVVVSTLPRGRDDAGLAALLSEVTALQQRGYAVRLVAADDMASAGLDLRAAGIRLCTVPLYVSVEDVFRRRRYGFDLVYLREPDIAARYAALARHHLPQARIAFSAEDLQALPIARQTAQTQPLTGSDTMG